MQGFNLDCTIVTGLIDIGRGDWQPAYRRPFSYYLDNFRQKTLSLRCQMVIFIQPEHEAQVRAMRDEFDPGLTHTRIIPLTFENLPRQSYRARIRAVLQSSYYKENALDPERPEYFSLDYNIVIHSKTALVKQVCQSNPFNSKFFLWMDAAIGHQHFPARLHNGYYPRAGKTPELSDGRIHLVCNNPMQPEDADIASFFLANINRTPADWWGGTASALVGLEGMCLEITEEALNLGVFDNEESVFTVAALRYPERFCIHKGARHLALTEF